MTNFHCLLFNTSDLSYNDVESKLIGPCIDRIFEQMKKEGIVVEDKKRDHRTSVLTKSVGVGKDRRDVPAGVSYVYFRWSALAEAFLTGKLPTVKPLKTVTPILSPREIRNRSPEYEESKLSFFQGKGDDWADIDEREQRNEEKRDLMGKIESSRLQLKISFEQAYRLHQEENCRVTYSGHCVDLDFPLPEIKDSKGKVIDFYPQVANPGFEDEKDENNILVCHHLHPEIKEADLRDFFAPTVYSPKELDITLQGKNCWVKFPTAREAQNALIISRKAYISYCGDSKITVLPFVLKCDDIKPQPKQT